MILHIFIHPSKWRTSLHLVNVKTAYLYRKKITPDYCTKKEEKKRQQQRVIKKHKHLKYSYRNWT